ncbi:MAG: hypothetical protein ABMA13_13735 [Chthoniobacteraceae bacterium]
MPTKTADSKPPETRPEDSAAAKTCPWCDTPLDAKNPTECNRCDWIDVDLSENAPRVATERDTYATVLSVVPGLGHIYKGHTRLGGLFMVGGFFAILGSFIAATATMGFGLLFIPWYWVGVMLHAYWLEDLVAAKAQGKPAKS